MGQVNVTSNDQGEQEDTPLPAVASPKERHDAHLDAGIHPEIDMDTSYWAVRNGLINGVAFDDGDELIQFIKSNQCPICGERGVVRVDYANIMSMEGPNSPEELADPRYTFVRDVVSSPREEGTNPTVERLKSDGFYPVVCKAGGRRDRFIGVASTDAVKQLNEWKLNSSERRSFERTAEEIATSDQIQKHHRQGHSKGVLLAAIFELLGADDYETRELIDRQTVTKGHLLTLLARLQTLDVEMEDDIHEDVWLLRNHLSQEWGDVEWTIPKWAGEDGIVYRE